MGGAYSVSLSVSSTASTGRAEGTPLADVPTRRPTIADVARAAGTSASLVSRYLTGNQRVSDASATRIREAVERLGYVPSATARNLRLRRTGLVALVVPYLDNPLYSLHATGAERELAAAGFLTVVCSTRTKPGGSYLGRSFFDTLGAGRVDGALIFPYQEEIDDLDRLRERGTPVVLIDRVPHVPAGMRGFDSVTVDNELAVFDACRRLVADGHRRIGLVSLRSGSLSGAPRYAGYSHALGDAGIELDPALVALGDGSEAGGAALFERLVDGGSRPSAVVIATTLQTRGALGAIRRRGLNVPGDLEVIGYRHDQSVLWPEVPTYRYPGEVLGEIGARMLLERLSGNGSPEVVTEHLTLEFVPATRPAGA